MFFSFVSKNYLLSLTSALATAGYVEEERSLNREHFLDVATASFANCRKTLSGLSVAEAIYLVNSNVKKVNAAIKDKMWKALSHVAAAPLDPQISEGEHYVFFSNCFDKKFSSYILVSNQLESNFRKCIVTANSISFSPLYSITKSNNGSASVLGKDNNLLVTVRRVYGGRYLLESNATSYEILTKENEAWIAEKKAPFKVVAKIRIAESEVNRHLFVAGIKLYTKKDQELICSIASAATLAYLNGEGKELLD